MDKDLEFCTMKQFYMKYPELFGKSALRKLVKSGYVPGVYIGKKFLINEKAFFQKLNNIEGGDSEI